MKFQNLLRLSIFQDFKKNLKGVNGGNDFEDSLLEEIYNSIKYEAYMFVSEPAFLYVYAKMFLPVHFFVGPKKSLCQLSKLVLYEKIICGR